jgi:hypothetical protein
MRSLRSLVTGLFTLIWFCGQIAAQDPASRAAACKATLYADVVALDQPIMLNRLGSFIPGGMIYALARDVVDASGSSSSAATCSSGNCKPGQVALRPGKRPRPIVLRMSVGDCLLVKFTNLVEASLPRTSLGWSSPNPDDLQNYPADHLIPDPATGKIFGQSATRAIGFHVAGLDLVSPPGPSPNQGPTGCLPNLPSDASLAGTNCRSLAQPGQTLFYKYYALEEGNFLVYSIDDAQGAPNANNAGQQQAGLFGSVNVQAANAEYFRSQVTHAELQLATYVACSATRTTQCVAEKFSDGPLGNMSLTAVRDTPTHAHRMVRAPELKDCTQGTAGLPLWTLTTLSVEDKRQTEWSTPVVKCEDPNTPSDKNDYLHSPDGHPVVNYSATYQIAAAGATAGMPVLNMLQAITPTAANGQATREIVYSDLTAIITGPGAGRFPDSEDSPSFHQNPALPDRREPFREFTIHYHVSNSVVQPFGAFSEGPLKQVLGAGADGFGINYGMAAIGPEVMANRLGVGPEAACVECKFEEFFLSSWAVGDPAMLVDKPTGSTSGAAKYTGETAKGSNRAEAEGTHDPTNASLALPLPQNPVVVPQIQPMVAELNATPAPVPKATMAYFPDDPSNVYHSYMRDHVKFRISNISVGQPHVHHQHAHQWLQTPNSDDAAYLDSQMIVPGSTYTLEMVYNGSGNRNQTVGDSIFHCHFYPHFAAGMWSLWRVHDVFEAGTILDANGAVRNIPWNRALPDGEIESGTPIPALVPLPTLGMAPIPPHVKLVDHGTRAIVEPDTTAAGKPEYRNPGYPFFVPGVAGHRAPHPPMDFAWEESTEGVPLLNPYGRKTYLDGGLPRHLILGGQVPREFHTRWDFTKDNIARDKNGMFLAGALTAYVLPEDGTDVERAAMEAHSRRTTSTWQPDGQPGNFILNGLPPAHGGPFARPDVDDNGNAVTNTRRYKAAVIQTDVVLNKDGWHYPQQRFLALWNDVLPTLTGNRPPEPLFFRANSGESVEYWHTNLVPGYYELDDFQVRTPTDIIGQHIHLVKFDVLASDGAANGFNYEDGTFSPDEVRDRIDAMNNTASPAGKGLHEGPENPATGDYPQVEACLNSASPVLGCIQKIPAKRLTAKAPPAVFGTDPKFTGAQTTIQLWDTDPLLNNAGKDRTLRTVFTHDHFGPSTHQNVGLYAGLLIEPPGSSWEEPMTGAPMYDRGTCFDTTTGQPVKLPANAPANSGCPANSARRTDGGPTSWQANIIESDTAESYREFALEFQDLQLAYTAQSKPRVTSPTAPLFVQPVSGTEFTQDVSTLSGGSLPTTLRAFFRENGIVLSGTAKAVTCNAAGVVPQTCWNVTDAGLPGVTLQLKSDPPTLSFEAYTPDMTPGWADGANALAPPGSDPYPTNLSSPYPLLIDTSPGVGTYSLNYRNEPVPLRVSGVNGSAGSGQQGDLAWAYSSLANRADPKLNVQPETACSMPPCAINPAQSNGFTFPRVPLLATPNNPNPMTPPDPYTPLLRAYENDRVQVRTLVGAHVTTHAFMLHGLNWLYEPDYRNSGYKSLQGMGLSEHFEMNFRMPSPVKLPNTPFSDYLYAPSSGVSGITQGLWGLLRAYDGSVNKPANLTTLPNNSNGRASTATVGTGCPAGALPRPYTVVATTPKLIGAPNDGITYNTRGQSPLVAPDSLIYVNLADLDPSTNHLTAGRKLEPLILRARAGECVQITLLNQLNSTASPASGTVNAPFSGTNSLFRFEATDADVQGLDSMQLPARVAQAFSENLPSAPLMNPVVAVAAAGSGWTIQSGPITYALAAAGNIVSVTSPSIPNITPSTPLTIGLHASEVSYNIRTGDGTNVGYNQITNPLPGTTNPGGSLAMQWYAGNIESTPGGNVVATPVEFGSLPLVPADPLFQAADGLIGALIVEPPNASWTEDANTHASATVTTPGRSFREFVLLLQSGLLKVSGNVNAAQSTDFYTASAGVNYRSEPMGLNVPPQVGLIQMVPPGFQPVIQLLDQCQVGSFSDCLSGNAGLQSQFQNAGKQSDTYGFTLVSGATSATSAGTWQIQSGANTFTVTYTSGRLNMTNSANTLLASLNATPQLVEALDGVSTGTAGTILQPLFTAANITGTATVVVGSPRQWTLTNGIYTFIVQANVTNGQINPPLQVTYHINTSANSALIDYSGYLFNKPTANIPPNNAPQTPIFCATAGQQVRFRVVQPGTDADQAFEIHGHSWEQEPYVADGRAIGHNPDSQQLGTQVISPNDRLDLVLDSAGGAFKQPGDYLYHAFMTQLQGMWGLFRVVPASADFAKACSNPAN